jgi:predicted metalloprotease with PDZ domain
MSAPTSYRLSFSAPHAHLIDAEARFADVAGLGREAVLRMAAWTPGSYLVRDYARHVQDVEARAEDGRRLRVEKRDKAAWAVELDGARDLVVRYRVYAWELTVRTSHVDATHAFLNGAPTYLWLAERAGAPFEVTLEPRPGWRVTTALAASGAGYRAADLDELLDSPILAAEGPHLEFDAVGRPHELAVWGRPEVGVATLEDLRRDTDAIVRTHAELFGGVPYARYAFLLLLAAGARGGLEHRASTALLAGPSAFSTRKKYEDLLELVSHEFFHLWNVKRLRPRALGPFDYTRENYTRALWVVEGLTSYYDRYALRRAGLITVKRYLDKLAEEWGALLAVPGRARQSVEESSFDAWIKLYRPDENSGNSTVSYYLKGSLVWLCLDLEIRRRTRGARSVDHALLALWRAYGQAERGYADEDVQGEVERAVELDLGDFFDRYVRGREDPDLAGALAACGYLLRARPERGDEDGPGAWLGAQTRAEEGKLVVTAVPTGSPAEAAGLYAGDELVALDGIRTSDERSLSERLVARRPGATAALLVFRRDEERRLEVTLGERPATWEIVADPGVGEAEQALGRGWLGGAVES